MGARLLKAEEGEQMSFGRIIVIFIIVLFLAVGAAITILMFNLDNIVASVIEDAGSDAVKTEVTVKSVSLGDISDGKASISGITIASPKGYTEPHVLTLGEISIDIDTDTLSGQILVIDEILIKAPFVAYEIDESGGTSVDTVKDNLPEGNDTGKNGGGEEVSGKDDIRLIIKSFVVEDGIVKVIAPMSDEPPKTSKLPRIEITDIGQEQGGVTPEEAATIIFAALFEQVGPVVLGMDVDKYLNDQTTKAREKAEKALGGKKMDKTLDEAKKALGGIFGN